MATITKQTIRVDLTPGRVYPVLHVSQGDVGLEALEFYVYQNGQPFTIPSEVTAINIDGMTPVGVFSYPCTWTGNVVTAGLTATMTAERGIDICELALYDATNNKIGTCNFVIAVEESPYTNAHVSTSDMATIMAAATEVQQNTLLSKSWAVGDTGIRTGEDTNNSKYWAEQSEEWVDMAESWAVGGTGKRTGEDTNNSKYYAEQSRIEGNGLASVFSDVIDYSVGDYVIYNGILYIFTKDHEAGAWNASDVSAVNLADSINDAFIDGIEFKRENYTSQYTGTSRVYYAIIPAEHKPQLVTAGNIGDVIYPEEYLPKYNPTLLINAGAFNTSTGEPIGLVIKDGDVVQQNTIYGTDNRGRYILYMDENGLLQAVTAIDHSAQDVVAAGAQWAVIAWQPIVINGEFVTGHDTDSAHPRTAIGQDAAGNYIVVVCDGRQYESRGMSYTDLYNFVVSVGFVPRILYNLDGGGACAMYANGVRVNSYNLEDHRAIPNALVFSTHVKNTPLMLSDKTISVADYWKNELMTTFRPTISAINAANFLFLTDTAPGIRALVRNAVGDGQYTFDPLFKIAYSKDAKSVLLEGAVDDVYQDLISFLPSNKVKVFQNEIFLLKSAGVDSTGSSADLKTYNINGVWLVPASNSDNPTSNDAILVGLAYGGTRVQMLINENAILIRHVNSAGTYATAWKTVYTAPTKTTVAVNTASGLTGSFTVIRNGQTVEIEGDIGIGTPVASTALNSSAFPKPTVSTVGAMLMCPGTNASLVVRLGSDGMLKFGANVTPTGGSLGSYGRISFVYTTAD